MHNEQQEKEASYSKKFIALSERYNFILWAGIYSTRCNIVLAGGTRGSDRDVNWMSPVQVKEPYGNFDMVTCRFSSCNRECTNYT